VGAPRRGRAGRRMGRPSAAAAARGRCRVVEGPAKREATRTHVFVMKQQGPLTSPKPPNPETPGPFCARAAARGSRSRRRRAALNLAGAGARRMRSPRAPPQWCVCKQPPPVQPPKLSGWGRAFGGTRWRPRAAAPTAAAAAGRPAEFNSRAAARPPQSRAPAIARRPADTPRANLIAVMRRCAPAARAPSGGAAPAAAAGGRAPRHAPPAPAPGPAAAPPAAPRPRRSAHGRAVHAPRAAAATAAPPDVSCRAPARASPAGTTAATRRAGRPRTGPCPPPPPPTTNGQ
jgi:hypothetical protein